MSLYRYLPYWRSIRDDLQSTLELVDDDVCDFTCHPALPTIGQLLLSLAEEQAHLLDWIQDPSSDPVHFGPDAFPTAQAKREVLAREFARIEAFAARLSREELTRQHKHPMQEGEHYSLYQLLWQLLRFEIHQMGKIDLQLEAYEAELNAQQNQASASGRSASDGGQSRATVVDEVDTDFMESTNRYRAQSSAASAPSRPVSSKDSSRSSVDELAEGATLRMAAVNPDLSDMPRRDSGVLIKDSDDVKRMLGDL